MTFWNTIRHRFSIMIDNNPRSTRLGFNQNEETTNKEKQDPKCFPRCTNKQETTIPSGVRVGAISVSVSTIGLRGGESHVQTKMESERAGAGASDMSVCFAGCQRPNNDGQGQCH